ncbi:MAG TPA: hypothetical protein VGR35_06070, partial [Tepidisphaeraceae bacterium]|nr:hypothetical protein [Tepidisphaeraceae bacterium]
MLKGHPDYANLDGLAPACEDAVRLWYAAALPYITTKDFLATFSAFLHAWDRILYPGGGDLLAIALNRADNAGVPRVALQGLWAGSIPTQRLIGLCRELQRMNGSGAPFYIDYRNAARLIPDLGCHVSAGKRLGM